MCELDMISQPSAIDSPSLQDLLIQRDNFYYDIGGQRSYVWDKSRKVELILSLLQNIKPAIITANVNGEVIEVADGQQRLNTIFLFLNNEFCISENTVLNLNVDGKVKKYDLSGMYFKDLPDKVKISLLSKNIRIEKYFGLNEKQLNLIMRRLNNGKALTNAERTKMENFGSIGNFIEDIRSMEFFERKARITKSSKEKSLIDMRVIITILGLECGVTDISIKNSQLISKEIRDNDLLTKDIRAEVIDTFNFIEKVFPATRKYLNKENIPVIYFFLKEVKNKGCEPRDIIKVLDSFYTMENVEGYGYTNTEAILKSNIDVLMKYFNKTQEKLA